MDKTRLKSVIIAGFFLILLSAYFSNVIAGTRDEMLNDALSQVKAALSKIPPEIKRVSVYAIEPDKEGKIDINSLQDQLTTILLDSERFQVIDRKALKALLEEQQLSMTGLVDTTKMVQAGKLIGIQGFFYGSVEVRNDRVILNLKLVDVQSSAIVFSKKFKGESTGFVSLGAGFAYTTMNIHFDGNDKADKSTGALGFILSYKQGFQGFNAGYIGVDLALMKSFDNSSNDIKRMDLKPRFIFSLKRLLGTEYDILTPYIGGSLSMALFGLNVSEPTAIGIYPLIGLDLNPTRFLTIFAEGMYMTRTQLRKGGTEYVPEGFVLTAGLKAYLTF
jgi:curli biogenesis system outer membrane secretion channel CsgG